MTRAITADAEERAARAAAEPADTASVDAKAPSRGKRRWLAYPTAPLAAASSLVVLALVAVAWLQISGTDRPDAALTAIASVDLRFEDRDDGSVAVINADNGDTIDVLSPGTNGFLRSTMRSFVRERAAVNAGPSEPFSLLQTETGRLVLHDRVTGRSVDLWAFGETNARAFGRFLSAYSTKTTIEPPIKEQAADDPMTTVALTSREK